MNITELIINKFERGKNWNCINEGNRSIRLDDTDSQRYDRETLVAEAKQLEKQKLIKIQWVSGYYNVDIERIIFSLSDMDEFYKLSEKQPKYKTISQQKEQAEKCYNKLETPWIRAYMEKEILKPLLKGKVNKDNKKYTLLLTCLTAMDELEEPVLKRIFSKRNLNNSKVFENELQKRIISAARKYCYDIDDSMESSDILEQLFIEEYSQELQIKGCLCFELEGNIINTENFCYGTTLNTKTIRKAKLLDNSQIRKVLTIENKANYVSEPYEQGTLIIFTHGYFSPIEREFLVRLRDNLGGQYVTYLHSGDLDFGGVRIFQYIKNRIFPECKPFRMDARIFDTYIKYGETLSISIIEKLKNIKEPLLDELICKMIETGLCIEQEAFL